MVTSEIKLKQNNFTETKHCFAFVLFQFYFSHNNSISEHVQAAAESLLLSNSNKHRPSPLWRCGDSGDLHDLVKLFSVVESTAICGPTMCRRNKMLSYRRETALQGAL